MNTKLFYIVPTMLISAFTTKAGHVIGYFPNWGIFGENPYTAEDVPYEKLTHIQYAFFKASYCKNKGYAGTIIWELKSGTLYNKSYPLLDAAAKVLLSPASITMEHVSSPDVPAFIRFLFSGACPSVSFHTGKATPVIVSIYDISGRLFRKEKLFFEAGSHTLQLPQIQNLHMGKFIAQYTINNRSVHQTFSNYK